MTRRLRDALLNGSVRTKIGSTDIGRSGYLLTQYRLPSVNVGRQRERTRRYDQDLADPQPRAGTKWIKNLGGENPPEPVSEGGSTTRTQHPCWKQVCMR